MIVALPWFPPPFRLTRLQMFCARFHLTLWGASRGCQCGMCSRSGFAKLWGGACSCFNNAVAGQEYSGWGFGSAGRRHLQVVSVSWGEEDSEAKFPTRLFWRKVMSALMIIMTHPVALGCLLSLSGHINFTLVLSKTCSIFSASGAL